MATASTRTVWKGAISFGLVHIPVALYTATAESRPKFNLIDKASMSPVGNRQVSKATGEAVQAEELVKGIEVEDGQYVVLSKEEIRSALPRSTQTIEIEAFVEATDIPPTYFQKPYYVAPDRKGQKAYLLLRDTLRKTGKAGLARVVISTRQHLAALMPFKDGLALNLLRWADEIRDFPASVMPDAGTAAPTDKELKMAEQLVNDMADAWSPDLFHDEFKEKLNALVQAKAAAGDIATLQPLEGEDVASPSAEIIDLTELLKRSLKAPPPAARSASTRAANDDAPVLKRAAGKTPAKARASVKPAARRKSA